MDVNSVSVRQRAGIETSHRFRPFHSVWRWMTDKIDVTNLELPVSRLPAGFAGLIACQVSDLHIDSEADLVRLEKAVKIINGNNPDIVFLTGDYFSGPRSTSRYVGSLIRTLTDLRAPLGVFAIAGNHDHYSSFWTIAHALSKACVRVLANENYALELGDSRVIIVGIDDLWSQRARPNYAFRGVEPGECTILLVHNPDVAMYVRHLRPGVILSGHTHGGIIRFPVYGSPVKSFLRIGKRFYSGLNRYEDFYIYTNRGLGGFPLGFRINCRPEVSVFRLSALPERPAKSVRCRRQTESATSGNPEIDRIRVDEEWCGN